LHIATLGPAVFFAAHANEILRTMTLIGDIRNDETRGFVRGEVQFFDYEILSAWEMMKSIKNSEGSINKAT